MGLLEHLQPSQHLHVFFNLSDFLLILLSGRKEIKGVIRESSDGRGATNAVGGVAENSVGLVVGRGTCHWGGIIDCRGNSIV
jgi:hypothetical protein